MFTPFTLTHLPALPGSPIPWVKFLHRHTIFVPLRFKERISNPVHPVHPVRLSTLTFNARLSTDDFCLPPSTVHRPLSTVHCPPSGLFSEIKCLKIIYSHSSTYTSCSSKRKDLFLFCSSETNHRSKHPAVRMVCLNVYGNKPLSEFMSEVQLPNLFLPHYYAIMA